MPKLGPATSSGSGRGGRGRRVSSSLAEINVVPLVDVMLVLLIIFMVTAPMLQRGIDVEAARRHYARAAVVGERVNVVTVPANYRDAHFRFRGQRSGAGRRLAGTDPAADGERPRKRGLPARRCDGAMQ